MEFKYLTNKMSSSCLHRDVAIVSGNKGLKRIVLPVSNIWGRLATMKEMKLISLLTVGKNSFFFFSKSECVLRSYVIDDI